MAERTEGSPFFIVQELPFNPSIKAQCSSHPLQEGIWHSEQILEEGSNSSPEKGRWPQAGGVKSQNSHVLGNHSEKGEYREVGRGSLRISAHLLPTLRTIILSFYWRGPVKTGGVSIIYALLLITSLKIVG